MSRKAQLREKPCLDCGRLIMNKSTRCQKCCGLGERASGWKGDNVGYSGLHYWVRKTLGKAKVCMWCLSEKNVEWADISHEYLRQVNDWMQLCRSCHRRYDHQSGYGSALRKYGKL